MYVFLGNMEEKTSERLKYYEKALSYDPDYIIAKIQMVVALAKTDEGRARMILNDLHQAHPNNFKVHWGMGQIEIELNNACDAVEHFKRALMLNPYHFSSAKELGYLYKLECDNDLCIFYYEEFIEMNPYDEEVYNYLGLAFDDVDRKKDGM